MNQLQMNEQGLSESLESIFAQISALASIANFTISTPSGPLYLAEAAQLLITIQNLAIEGERYRAEWANHIPRTNR